MGCIFMHVTVVSVSAYLVHHGVSRCQTQGFSTSRFMTGFMGHMLLPSRKYIISFFMYSLTSYVPIWYFMYIFCNKKQLESSSIRLRQWKRLVKTGGGRRFDAEDESVRWNDQRNDQGWRWGTSTSVLYCFSNACSLCNKRGDRMDLTCFPHVTRFTQGFSEGGANLW